MAPATTLAQEHCVACKPGTPTLPPEEARRLQAQVPSWRVEGDRLTREWRLRDFAACLALVQAIGRIAEVEDHHPDLHLTGYRNLRAELTTHAAGGLTRNDFVLAARIDGLAAEPKASRRGEAPEAPQPPPVAKPIR